ncbi:MAG: hypothetical protein PHF67_01080 [Candidatus Nanoarchaeia archaeon]|nr:hypothetical protein [Candidatus Nanoarchaeia archaeon]
MIRKKAQGEIITTVLIILLILAAIVIVWQVVQSSVSRGGEQAKSQTSCIGLNYVILKVNSTGSIQIRRDTGAPDVASFTARVFVDSVDTGKTVLVGGELNTTTFEVAPSPVWNAGSKLQLAPIVSGTQCDLGPEKLITLK